MNEKFSRAVSYPRRRSVTGWERNIFEIDDEKAKVVRMIYQDFSSGNAIPPDCLEVKRHGNPYEPRKSFLRAGRWSTSLPIRFTREKLRRSAEGVRRNDRYYQENRSGLWMPYKPIVTEESFEKVQRRVADLKKGGAGGTHDTPGRLYAARSGVLQYLRGCADTGRAGKGASVSEIRMRKVQPEPLHHAG